VLSSAAFGVAALLAACAPHSTPASMSPSPTRAMRGDGPLTRDEEARHVLDRLAFGPRPGDVERVSAMGIDRWIDAQLHPETIPDAEAERVLASMETQRKRAFELIADHPDPQEIQQRFGNRPADPRDSMMIKLSQQTVQRLASQIATVRIVRAVVSERQLLEVMTDFWENHFSVYAPKSPNRYSMIEYDRDVVRSHALGKFRDLLGAVAKSPQMLFYLDNWQSGVDSLHPTSAEERIDARRRTMASDTLFAAFASPIHRRPRGINENYARELMELHTLGVDGGYTQHDVQEVARALTGWTIDSPNLGGDFVFRADMHDAGQKVVLGHTLAAGRGIEDGDEVLDILARSPATAHYITLKLARHFVSDDPPPALVDRCARAFTTSDGDIRETLRCIVTSREFLSRAAYRAKVKTPFELVTSALRAMNAPPDTTPRQTQLVAQLGQPIYGRLTPDGWPDRGDAWMNTGAIMNRINFGLRLAGGQVAGVRLADWPATARLRQLPVEEQVNGVVDELLGGDVSTETRAILLSGENPTGMTTLRPVASSKGAPQASGLAGIVGLALGAPEFQRR
jgi:uncharacterized protein (DUF1800 family)